MSKKKKINKGSFYYSYWGEPHPAQIYEVDKKYKTYKSIRFGTTKRKHMTEIRPIQRGIKKSFVKNRPFIGVRSDYGDRELLGLSIDSRDKDTIEKIKSNNPEVSKRAKARYKKMPSAPNEVKDGDLYNKWDY